MTKRLASTIKPRRLTSDYVGGMLHNADAEKTPTENKRHAFDLSSTLFRKSATKCAELAQSAASREQRALFLKMTRMWEQLAQSWDKKQLVQGSRRPLPPQRRPKLKMRQRSKIEEIRAALADAGFVALGEQAAALGLPRSTAWSVLNPTHRSSGLEARTISRILGSPRLFGPVQQKTLEYTQQKIEGLYGHTARRRREFAKRLMASVA